MIGDSPTEVLKRFAPGSKAHGFSDLYGDLVVDTFHEELRLAQENPDRASTEDFLSTITQVTSIEDDDFTPIQKEKVQLLSKYRDDIDYLLDE